MIQSDYNDYDNKEKIYENYCVVRLVIVAQNNDNT